MKLTKWLAPVLSLSLLLPSLAGGTIASAAEPLTPTVETPAVELRATFDYLLSEHFTLAVDSMIKKYDNTFDAAAAQGALEKNAKDMVPAVASVYGNEGAKEFDRIFSGHLNYTKDYVAAVKSNNAADKAEVAQEIEAFAVELGNFLAAATANNLPASTAQSVLRTHEQQVKEVFDDYVAGNYDKSLMEYREGLSFMYTISGALSGAIVTQMPVKFDNTRPDTAAGNLRSALNYLAAEHYALAVMSMQKGYDKSSAYKAILGSESANTDALTGAITSVYGAEGGAAFKSIWLGDHINAQDEIVKAAIAGNKEESMKARVKLTKFAKDFGNFLGTATGGNLPAKDAIAAIVEHERLVLEAFDLYQAKDASGLYTSYDKGYSLMFGVGKALGGAIVKQNPELFKSAPPVMPENPGKVMKIWLQIKSKTAMIDGKKVQMDVAPSIEKSTTFVSLRTLTEALGAHLKWVPANQTVEVMVGADKVVFWLGKDIATVNGSKVKLEAAVHAVEGRTQVPLRFIAELLGWDLNWNKADWSITLTKAM